MQLDRATALTAPLLQLAPAACGRYRPHVFAVPKISAQLSLG